MNRTILAVALLAAALGACAPVEAGSLDPIDLLDASLLGAPLSDPCAEPPRSLARTRTMVMDSSAAEEIHALGILAWESRCGRPAPRLAELLGIPERDLLARVLPGTRVQASHVATAPVPFGGLLLASALAGLSTLARRRRA